MAIINTNNNVKNSRYQIIGGSCSAIMGFYVFDPWLLKISGFTRKIWRIQDYASDMLVLSLAYAITIEKLVNIECKDHGKMVVKCAFLLFMREMIYGVN